MSELTQLTAADRERYHRHLVLGEFGEEGQRRLKAARILIVGGGGLGSPAALYLAAAGVGTLGIVDFDRVDISNLQRQVLYSHSDIGQPKVLAAAARLRALNPEIAIQPQDLEVSAANVMSLVANYDVVVDGSDRLSTRYQVNDACVLQKKMLVSAAIYRFEGQTFSYSPGRGPCYRCVFPSAAEGVTPNCAEAGVLGVLPGILGTIQATEAIKLITGIGTPLLGRLLMFDALSMRFDEFRIARRADCAVCGERPTITAPIESGAPVCSAEQRARIRQLKPAELAARVNDKHGASSARLRLVDVRQPHEFAVANLPDSINLPLGELATHLPDLLAESGDARLECVFLCRSGGRSQQACELAVQAGLATAINLDGGLLAWARDVEPAFNVATP
jgi:molybdopterin/thiamine biosynthesis adenylyltransferase/rhodanese-related sulfurtransferase